MLRPIYSRGAVYVFENDVAQRVKVGLTAIGVNDVSARLRDINDMWLGRKLTCQICGRRCIAVDARIPHHVGVNRGCPGGNQLPLERDTTLAEAYLARLRLLLGTASGTEKGSVARRITTLAKRINRYRHEMQRTGEWEFRTAFYTDQAAEVESLAHVLLREHLDEQAPFGEVFHCSAAVATEAVESAMRQLGVLKLARSKTEL